MRPRIESSDRHERIVNSRERIVDSRDVLGIHGPERDGIGFGISDHYATGKSNHVTGKGQSLMGQDVHAAFEYTLQKHSDSNE